MKNIKKILGFVFTLILSIMATILWIKNPLKAEENLLSKQEERESRYDEGWLDGFDCGWDAHKQPEISFDSQHGLKGLKNVVVRIKSDEKNELDLSMYLSNYVESRLRAIGINITKEEFDLETGTLSIYYRNVKADSDKYHIRISIALSQIALIRRPLKDTKIDYAVIGHTWEKGDRLYFDQKNPRNCIRDYLEEGLDDFTNSWLKENSKASPKLEN